MAVYGKYRGPTQQDVGPSIGQTVQAARAEPDPENPSPGLSPLGGYILSKLNLASKAADPLGVQPGIMMGGGPMWKSGAWQDMLRAGAEHGTIGAPGTTLTSKLAGELRPAVATEAAQAAASQAGPGARASMGDVMRMAEIPGSETEAWAKLARLNAAEQAARRRFPGPMSQMSPEEQSAFPAAITSEPPSPGFGAIQSPMAPVPAGQSAFEIRSVDQLGEPLLDPVGRAGVSPSGSPWLDPTRSPWEETHGLPPDMVSGTASELANRFGATPESNVTRLPPSAPFDPLSYYGKLDDIIKGNVKQGKVIPFPKKGK